MELTLHFTHRNCGGFCRRFIYYNHRKQSRSLAAKTGREMKPYFLTKSEKTDTYPNISESDKHILSRKKPASQYKHTEPEVWGMESAEEQWHGCDQC
jgi:hypothetical protein